VKHLGGFKGGVIVAVAALAIVAASCGSSSDSASKKSSATTTAASDHTSTTASKPASKTLTILVSNDDGFNAPGIDALVTALAKLPATKLEVAAPSTDKSGTGGKSTPGALTAHDAATKSGFPAHSVDGYPADSVRWALVDHGVPVRPQLVMSGSNDGQNLGPAADFSGTIGAAREGVAQGIPALAMSSGTTGTGSPPDFSVTVNFALQWLAQHRAAILAGSEPVAVTNLNAPTCSKGTVRGLLTLPPAPVARLKDALGAAVDCTQTTTNPATDVDGFLDGYAVMSSVPNTPAS
jgi:5'-nucleotidase